MNNKTVIEITGLGKRYSINKREKYLTLRDKIVETSQNLFRKKKKKKKNFWALRDINLEVKRGEVLGIIGSNGAGKSTLLKILARVTEPTEGKVVMYGKIASLLEVGTGFNQELTGRENIFLNGAILGMSRKEIKNKFNKIIRFSGIGKFIDTPVKRYSSGMYIRLAFAVAAHLESDILLIDEVLAVGDMEFRKKCLGKISSMASSGRTVVFISHDLSSIRSLCTRTILIENGKIIASGRNEAVIKNYSKSFDKPSKVSIKNRLDRRGNGVASIVNMFFTNNKGVKVKNISSGDSLTVNLSCRNKSKKNIDLSEASLLFLNTEKKRMFKCSSFITGSKIILKPGIQDVKCIIPKLPLAKGKYFISPLIKTESEIIDSLDNGIVLTVLPEDFFSSGVIPPDSWNEQDVLVINHWSLESDQ